MSRGGPPCPPSQSSRIPVRQGPNPRYHNPVSFAPRPPFQPRPPPGPVEHCAPQGPSQAPFRYMMVPGFPRGMRPGYHIDPNEDDPFARMHNVQDIIEVQRQEEAMEAARRRNPPRPRVRTGERATGFEDLCGTDPSNPYGHETWTAPDFDAASTDGVHERFDIGRPLTREPIFERDRFGITRRSRRDNNTMSDFLKREWDMDLACMKEPHLHRDRDM